MTNDYPAASPHGERALDFRHVLPSQGTPLLHTAREAHPATFSELFIVDI